MHLLLISSIFLSAFSSIKAKDQESNVKSIKVPRDTISLSKWNGWNESQIFSQMLSTSSRGNLGHFEHTSHDLEIALGAESFLESPWNFNEYQMPIRKIIRRSSPEFSYLNNICHSTVVLDAQSKLHVLFELEPGPDSDLKYANYLFRPELDCMFGCDTRDQDQLNMMTGFSGEDFWCVNFQAVSYDEMFFCRRVNEKYDSRFINLKARSVLAKTLKPLEKIVAFSVLPDLNVIVLGTENRDKDGSCNLYLFNYEFENPQTLTIAGKSGSIEIKSHKCVKSIIASATGFFSVIVDNTREAYFLKMREFSDQLGLKKTKLVHIDGVERRFEKICDVFAYGVGSFFVSLDTTLDEKKKTALNIWGASAYSQNIETFSLEKELLEIPASYSVMDFTALTRNCTVTANALILDVDTALLLLPRSKADRMAFIPSYSHSDNDQLYQYYPTEFGNTLPLEVRLATTNIIEGANGLKDG
jgi:hypothetical protein